MPESVQQVAVALLYESTAAAAHLRDGLAAAGVSIAYQALTADFDRISLEESRAQVVLVNLDPSGDGDLDQIHALLDDQRYNVIFNDSQVTSTLEGWDQARWLRHLLAKIQGAADLDPPRPADATPVPAESGGADATGSDGQAEAAVASEAMPTDAAEAPVAALEAGGPDADTLVFDGQVDVSEGMPGSGAHAETDGVTSAAVDVPSWQAAVDTSAGSSDADAITDGALMDGSVEMDFDAMFADTAFSAVDDAAPADDSPAVAPEMEGPSTGWSIETPDIAPAVDAEAAAPADAVDDAVDDAAPADDPAMVAPEMEGASAGWSIETPDIAPAVDAEAAAPVDIDLDDFGHLFQDDGSDSSSDTAPVEADDEVAIGLDEDVLAAMSNTDAPAIEVTERSAVGLELAPLDAVPESASAEEFGIETVSAASFLAPETDGAAAPEVPQTFDFELVPLEEAVAPTPIEETVSEFRLGTVRQTRAISRVWVLAAGVGGPEAVAEFLAAIPTPPDALVILAQDIGEDFIDIVQQQLAAATTLPVRIAEHGGRASHGEVLLVPPTRAFAVDGDGVVTLREQQAGVSMIRSVLHMAADEFGSAAGAIIFSGMSNDADDGVQYLHDRGGVIHAQDAESCVASILPDGARGTGVVGFVGPPRELAKQLLGEAR